MSKLIALFMCGDVVTDRGIDQVMPYSCDSKLYEHFMKSAKGLAGGFIYLAIFAQLFSASCCKKIYFILRDYFNIQDFIDVCTLTSPITRSISSLLHFGHFSLCSSCSCTDSITSNI